MTLSPLLAIIYLSRTRGISDRRCSPCYTGGHKRIQKFVDLPPYVIHLPSPSTFRENNSLRPWQTEGRSVFLVLLACQSLSVGVPLKRGTRKVRIYLNGCISEQSFQCCRTGIGASFHQRWNVAHTRPSASST